MRIAAIILNVLLLISVGFLIANTSVPSPDNEFFGVFLFLVITPVFTIATLLSKSESWLTLYFRRKTAEERRRIAQIEGNQDPQQPPPPAPLTAQTTRLPTDLYAGFWKRFAAALIDGVIIVISGTVIEGAFGFVFYGAITGIAENAEFLESIIAITWMWLYSALFESSSKQATPGKMALGIKVTDLDGNPVSFDKATGRFFGKIISHLIVFIGYIMIAFTERKQGLHDKMAGCLVVNK